ncbi:hypothetical protein [Aureivirga sp. CE67]|uniref:hypothetical protein n=1 Tax=Aureivirga sp. CE67 TaxID=1788983 RepID=UPI0018CAC583|nr:hypothetical protein [Aureivirga sp. CE67]
MKKITVSIFSLFFFISCSKKELIKTEFQFFDSFRKRKDEVLFFEKTISSDKLTTYYYYFDENRLDTALDFKIFEEKLLLEHDTILLTQKIKLETLNDTALVFLYGSGNISSPPHGSGVWIFTKNHGMIGNGLDVGGKLILNKFDNQKINSKEIKVLIDSDFYVTKPPPPPPEPVNIEKILNDIKNE